MGVMKIGCGYTIAPIVKEELRGLGAIGFISAGEDSYRARSGLSIDHAIDFANRFPGHESEGRLNEMYGRELRDRGRMREIRGE